jgi:hypothetical protein
VVPIVAIKRVISADLELLAIGGRAEGVGFGGDLRGGPHAVSG